MEQNTAIDPKTREMIWILKHQIKQGADELRRLKLCRKTRNELPDRKAVMSKLNVTHADDLPWAVQCRKVEMTARHILYGRLRGKAHPVVEPEQYAFEVSMIERRLRS